MVKKLMKEKSVHMATWVLNKLIERGDISDRDDAIKKLADPNWLINKGFGNVTNLMTSDIGLQVIDDVFAKKQESENH